MRKTALFFVLLVMIGFASKARFAIIMQDYENTTVKGYEEFLKGTNVDYHSFVAYNCDPHLYLADNIKPAAPFFTLQDFAISRNEQLRKLVADAFNEKHPQWILFSSFKDEQPAIQKLLNNSYRMVKYDKVNQLTLYEYDANH